MYRMRRWPAPLSVTLPPPSSTTIGEVLTTFAVSVITMVTGSGPQLNVMIPPSATASTTACDVQLAGVPVPITRSGCEVSTGRASSGSGTPPGFPGMGSESRSAVALATAEPSIRERVLAAFTAVGMTDAMVTSATIGSPRRTSFGLEDRLDRYAGRHGHQAFVGKAADDRLPARPLGDQRPNLLTGCSGVAEGRRARPTART